MPDEGFEQFGIALNLPGKLVLDTSFLNGGAISEGRMCASTPHDEVQAMNHEVEYYRYLEGRMHENVLIPEEAKLGATTQTNGLRGFMKGLRKYIKRIPSGNTEGQEEVLEVTRRLYSRRRGGLRSIFRGRELEPRIAEDVAPHLDKIIDACIKVSRDVARNGARRSERVNFAPSETRIDQRGAILAKVIALSYDTSDVHLVTCTPAFGWMYRVVYPRGRGIYDFAEANGFGMGAGVRTPRYAPDLVQVLFHRPSVRKFNPFEGTWEDVWCPELQLLESDRKFFEVCGKIQ